MTIALERYLKDVCKTPVGIVAVLTGLCLPLLVLGNAVLAIMLGIAVLIALVCFRPMMSGQSYLPLLTRPVSLAGAGMLVWFLITAAYSLDPVASLLVIARSLIFVAIGMVLILVLSQNARARYWSESSFLIGLGFFIPLAAGISNMEREAVESIYFWKTVPLPGLIYKSYQSVMPLVVPLAMWIGWQRGGYWWWIACIVFAGSVFLILGNGVQPSRAATFGFIVMALSIPMTCLLLNVHRTLRLCVIGALVLLVMILAGAVLSSLPSLDSVRNGVPDTTDPASYVDSHRQAIWSFVLDQALQSPILGVGPDAINKVAGASEMIPGIRGEYVPSHPHNWVLEIWAETGIVGLCGLIGVIFLLFREFWRRAAQAEGYGFVGIAILAGFFTSSLANFSIWASWWQMAFICALILPSAAGGGAGGKELAEQKAVLAVERPGRNRLAAIVVIGILSLLTALIWYARQTEQGRILYVRIKAESPYIYDRIAPHLLEISPADLLDPHSLEDARAIQQGVIDAIWGPEGLPFDLLPKHVEKRDITTYLFEQLAGVSAVERFVIPINNGHNSVGYTLFPENPNGHGVIYTHGYAGTIGQASGLAGKLIARGYTVSMLNFPGYGENTLETFYHEQFGRVSYGRDYQLYFDERPLRYYIEPTIVAANYQRDVLNLQEISAIGFSAGGWITAVAAAADPRIQRSVSVASFLPFYMRSLKNTGEWTPPHLSHDLIQAANYVEIPMLAALGKDRAYLQIFNRYDRCCYANRRGALIQNAVSERLETIAAGGRFGVMIDETHARHHVSLAAQKRMIKFLENGILEPEEHHPPPTEFAHD